SLTHRTQRCKAADFRNSRYLQRSVASRRLFTYRQREATPQVPKLCDTQPDRHHEMPRRAKTGIFTPSRINPKTIAAANSTARSETGSGAMAIPRRANV